MKREIRIVIADDHPIVRQGLRQVIEADPAITVVAEEGNGAAALDRIRALRPDVAVLDIDMPELDGLGVAREITKQQLPVKIIFLTVHRDQAFFRAAMDAGAQG